MSKERKKVALVTGASSGIGWHIALYLNQEGFKTIAAARRLEKMEPLKKLGITTVRLDVTDTNSIDTCLNEIRRKVGEIDILVNNAGIAEMGPAELVPLQIGRDILEVNFFGLVTLTQKCLPYMREQRWGRIINVSSGAGILSQPFNSWYDASKHAVEGFTKSLRQEMAQFGVAAAIIRPGVVVSELMNPVLEAEEESYLNDDYREPFQRLKKETARLYANSSAGEPAARSVAQTVLKAILARRPRVSYNATRDMKIAAFVFKFLLPESFGNSRLGAMMGSPNRLDKRARIAARRNR